MKKVILITGPGGSGKTTIARLLKKEFGYVLLDGDKEDTKFFPNGGQWLPENSDKLEKAQDKILNIAKELVKDKKKVVVDYIVFGNYTGFFDKFRKAFGGDLQIVVLFPEQSEIVVRDKERECWTTGVDRIKSVYCEFEKLKDGIGEECYFNTSDQTPEETFVWLSKFLF